MFNYGIVRLLLGKTEADAVATLQNFKCKWRIYAVEGVVSDLSSDRDDNRYNLIITDGLVTRVMQG